MKNNYKLYAIKGGGNVIVEAAMVLCDVPYQVERLAFSELGPSCAKLNHLNPLGQVPTLVTPAGDVLCESAAIIMHLHRLHPRAHLVPGGTDQDRFFRWLLFLTSAIYPTFSFGDFPERWVDEPSVQDEFVRRTGELRKRLWLHVEREAVCNPWFLACGRSALDLYLWAMTQWEPGPEWFAAQCPKLAEIGKTVGLLPSITEIEAANFPIS